MTDAPPVSDSANLSPDPRIAMQFLLLLDVAVRLLIWSMSLAVTLVVAIRFGGWADIRWSDLGRFAAAWDVARRAVDMLLLFNVAYLLILGVLRILTPTPKPGGYSLVGHRLDRNLIYCGLMGVLTKARYQAPFPAFLVPQLANIAPFRWLFNWKLGPHTKSVFFVDPNILDPSFVTIGKNVTIGFGTTIAAHVQDRRILLFQPTVIEDDVLIGAHVAIPGGVTIKRGAVIRACSSLMPGDVVGENEYWAGFPATKVQDLKPIGARKR